MNRLLVISAWGLVFFGFSIPSEAQQSDASDPPARSQAASKAPDKPSANSRPKSAATPVTSEEATQWGAALEHAVRVNDDDSFNRLVDWDALAEKATAIAGDSPKFKEFRANLARAVKAAAASPLSGFGRTVIGAVERSGDYKPLRVHSEGSDVRVLFRLVSNNGALNYHDWVLAHSSQGKTVATDCYIVSMGELYSQNLHRSFLPVARKSGASVEKLAPADRDFVEHFSQFAQMGNAIRKRDWQQVLEIYNALPTSVRESKPAMSLRLLATQAASKAEYPAAMDEFRKRYPNDPMIDLFAVDAYVLRKAYDEALESIDRLDKIIGGDPYLKVVRANVLLRQKKLDAARDMAQDAIARGPKLVRGYYSLIEISLARHDFADTVRWLKEGESQGFTFKDLTMFPSFAEFVKSPEYNDWVKTHPKEANSKK